ncbi:MAG: HD-GYP domain-containing protein [Candidatus Eisenbacteria sp.]|nr:HD-GYP domain-containing protein [Candidatus Eisenbacteria bacterium]
MQISMSEVLRDEFRGFVRRHSSDLIRDLAELLKSPVQILDAHGQVILSSTDQADAASRDDGTMIRVPIKPRGELVGSLETTTNVPQVRTEMDAVATSIARHLLLERNLDRMNERLRQCDIELDLLCQFAQILKSGESFSASTKKLLEETSLRLERRPLVLYKPRCDLLDLDGSQTNILECSAGRNSCPEVVSWLTSGTNSADTMETIHATFTQATENTNPASAQRCTGVVDSPHGLLYYAATPLWTRSGVAGFVAVFRTESEGEFDRSEIKLVECLAREISNTSAASQLNQELRDMLFNTVRSLVAATDAKDRFTRGHSARVYDHSIKLGRYLDIPDCDMQTLGWASLLHDIGKIAIAGDILMKPGPLTDEEYEEIKTHPVKGCEMLWPIPQLRAALPAIRHHHERFDGNGYPDGLKGEEIPLIARIISVADTYDAIISTRAHRKAASPESALEEIGRCMGTQFDPEVATAFLEIVTESSLDASHAVTEDRAAA